MVKVINKNNFVIQLNEQIVKELMHAIKKTNESEEPVGEIMVESEFNQNTFQITLGESESVGFKIVAKKYYAKALDEIEGDKNIGTLGDSKN